MTSADTLPIMFFPENNWLRQNGFESDLVSGDAPLYKDGVDIALGQFMCIKKDYSSHIPAIQQVNSAFLSKVRNTSH